LKLGLLFIHFISILISGWESPATHESCSYAVVVCYQIVINRSMSDGS
jgi:hypothetical protein